MTIQMDAIASASSASWYHSSGTPKLSCKQCFVVPFFWYAEALLQAMSLYIQRPLPCKSLLDTAQTRCSASCRCRLRVFSKRSFSTPQECAAITGRDVHRDWDCIPTSRARTARFQCRACSLAFVRTKALLAETE